MIEAHLPVATKEEAVSFVVNWLKEANLPFVILKRKVDDYWIVDLAVTKDGKQINLVNDLEKEDLLIK